MHPAMGGQITRTSFYGKASSPPTTPLVCDGSVCSSWRPMEARLCASVRVPDGGVLQAPNAFTWRSRQVFTCHDSLSTNVSCVQCDSPPQLPDNDTGIRRRGSKTGPTGTQT